MRLKNFFLKNTLHPLLHRWYRNYCIVKSAHATDKPTELLQTQLIVKNKRRIAKEEEKNNSTSQFSSFHTHRVKQL